HEHVADSELDMIQNDNMESPLGNLAVKAYRWTTGADLSAEEISLTGVSIAKGPLTKMDLHDVVPHIYDSKTNKEWSLYIWNAKGRDIHTLFGAFHMISAFLGFGSPLGWLSSDNTQVIWDPSQQGMGSIRALSIGGVPIDLNQKYKVAISAGLLKGLTIAAQALPFLGLDLSDVKDTGQEVWTSIVSYAANKKILTREEFKVGASVHTDLHDLAVPYYGIQLDESGLHVDVENNGMKESPTGTLNCYIGLHDDLISFGTDLQQWSLIGTVSLNSIPSQSKVSTSMSWGYSRLNDGYWPVRCEANVAGDNYQVNNQGNRVFKLPLQREKF
ncbi:MAG: 5'-nucleotidase C-terminal domain-containing protein, partial [Bdellovibrionota bacterium]